MDVSISIGRHGACMVLIYSGGNGVNLSCRSSSSVPGKCPGCLHEAVEDNDKDNIRQERECQRKKHTSRLSFLNSMVYCLTINFGSVEGEFPEVKRESVRNT